MDNSKNIKNQESQYNQPKEKQNQFKLTIPDPIIPIKKNQRSQSDSSQFLNNIKNQLAVIEKNQEETQHHLQKHEEILQKAQIQQKNYEQKKNQYEKEIKYTTIKIEEIEYINKLGETKEYQSLSSKNINDQNKQKNQKSIHQPKTNKSKDSIKQKNYLSKKSIDINISSNNSNIYNSNNNNNNNSSQLYQLQNNSLYSKISLNQSKISQNQIQPSQNAYLQVYSSKNQKNNQDNLLNSINEQGQVKTTNYSLDDINAMTLESESVLQLINKNIKNTLSNEEKNNYDRNIQIKNEYYNYDSNKLSLEDLCLTQTNDLIQNIEIPTVKNNIEKQNQNLDIDLDLDLECDESVVIQSINKKREGNLKDVTSLSDLGSFRSTNNNFNQINNNNINSNNNYIDSKNLNLQQNNNNNFNQIEDNLSQATLNNDKLIHLQGDDNNNNQNNQFHNNFKFQSYNSSIEKQQQISNYDLLMNTSASNKQYEISNYKQQISQINNNNKNDNIMNIQDFSEQQQQQQQHIQQIKKEDKIININNISNNSNSERSQQSSKYFLQDQYKNQKQDQDDNDSDFEYDSDSQDSNSSLEDLNDNSQIFQKTKKFNFIGQLNKKQFQKQIKLIEVYNPNPFYIKQVQKEIQLHMRQILYIWIAQVCSEYQLKRETMYMAFNYIDRYLSKQNIEKSNYQLIGVGCLMISAKMEEIYSPCVQEFINSTDNHYTEEQLKQTELEILKTLNWLLNPPTPLMLAHGFMCQWDEYQKINNLYFLNENLQNINNNNNDNNNNIVRQYCFLEIDPYCYQNYRKFMQILDFVQFEYATLQYKIPVVLASILYIQIGQDLNIFTRSQIINQFTVSSSYLNIINPQEQQIEQELQNIQQSQYNYYFQNFLKQVFDINSLQELLPTIQYIANFWILQLSYEDPSVVQYNKYKHDITNYNEFITFQTYNQNWETQITEVSQALNQQF